MSAIKAILNRGGEHLRQRLKPEALVARRVRELYHDGLCASHNQSTERVFKVVNGDVLHRYGSPSANALWVFDRDHIWGIRPETRDGFVVWPPPGYVSYHVAYPQWSFSYASTDSGGAKVTITRYGQALDLRRNQPVNGYGENTLVWQLQQSFSSPSPIDAHYRIVLHNVMVEEGAHHLNYTVTIFGPDR